MNNICRQYGTSLIEVLVTMLVVGIGILGLVTVQGASMKNISNANYDSLATIYAYDMVERMRANPQGVLSNSYNLSYKSDSRKTDPSCDPCSSTANRALKDAYEWESALINAFPEGVEAQVSFNATTGIHQIAISWSELSNAAETAGADRSFTLSSRVLSP